MSVPMARCRRCGGRLREDALSGLRVCESCGWGFTTSGKSICPACVRGECYWCVSWMGEGGCSHECFHQAYYGSPEDIGYITAEDW